jgi:multidrug transporter EmrE-like cation transporter
MLKLVLILLVALVLEAIGVVFLSQGLKTIGEPTQFTAPELARVVRQGLTNRYLLLGVLFETVFFVLLLVMLRNWDVSLVWPLTSIGFVLTTLAAKFLRHEEVSALRWGGVLLIVLGAGLVGYSERLKTPSAPTAARPPETAPAG